MNPAVKHHRVTYTGSQEDDMEDTGGELLVNSL